MITEGDEEIILANLIEGFNFFKPLLNGNKLDRFRTDEFADTFATKSIIIFNFIFDDFRVRYNLHIVMIIRRFLDQVNKFICCQFLLTHHLEKCCHLWVVNWIIWLLQVLFWDFWRYCRRCLFQFDWLQLRFLHRNLSWRLQQFLPIVNSLSEGVAATGPPRW